MENKEQDGFDSGRSSSSNPILLPEVIVYGKKPLPWYQRALNGVAKFINDEILLNKNNVRVKNARAHPKAMEAVLQGGNIAGAIIAAPVAAYAAVLAAPVVLPALRVAGLAMTPSTWIGGGMLAAGYQAPAWLLNGADLALSAHFANEAGKDIDKNGLTWRTGFNALMTLSPLTRETEAIEGVANTLRRPTQAVSSVVDDFRAARNATSSPEAVLGRELSRSVENTLFINIPVEHVSPNGVTKGSALDVGAEGIHLSPAGSSTTTTIQQKTGYPFVRTGTWTVSNNTRPVEVLDVGYFGKGFNSDFDSKVSNGITNFRYTNNFEGKGNTSYLTMEPSQGLLLSKNKKIAEDDRYLTLSAEIVPEGLKLPDGTYTPKMEDASKKFADLKEYFQDFKVGEDPSDGYLYIVFNQNGVEFPIGRFPKLPNVWYVLNPQSGEWKSFSQEDGYAIPLHSAKNYALKLRNDLIKLLDYPGLLIVKRSKIVPDKRKAIDDDIDVGGTEIGSQMISSLQRDIDEVYLSPEYIDRFMEHIGGGMSREDVMTRIKRDLQRVRDKTKPVLFKGDPNNRGISWVSISPEGDQLFFTGLNPYLTISNLKYWDSTLFHEFGHMIYKSNTPTARFITGTNHDLTLDIKDHIATIPKNADEAKYIDYISRPNEFRQRVMESVRYGIREGLTPEEIYDSPIMNKTRLREYFDKDYLVKMFKYMLAATPLLAKNNNNDRTN